MTRRELLEEERRIKRLRKEGRSEQFIKSWLRGWRMVKPIKPRR